MTIINILKKAIGGEKSMPKANIFGNVGVLRGIGGRGADDKFEPPEAAILARDDRPFGF
jgi:hypothetical protein